MRNREDAIFKIKDLIFSVVLPFGLSIILFFFYKPIGLIGFILSFISGFALYKEIEYKKKAFSSYLENIDQDFTDITKTAVFKMPFPMAIFYGNGEIIWYNTRFKKIFPESEILHEDIRKLLKDVNIKKLKLENKGDSFDTIIDFRIYKFFYNVVESKQFIDNRAFLIYGIDRTDDENLKKKYFDERTSIMSLNIDNFDEIQSLIGDENKPIVFAEIDKAVNSFALEYNGFSRKYETDKYLLFFNKRDVDKMIVEKFPIMEKVHNIDVESKISPTLSIGLATNLGNPLEVFKISRLALDIALGRGGDQVVVNDGENISYYGGKSKAVEKYNKVKSRVISHALGQLIDQSNVVYVTGHKNPDMDSFGSCLGIYAFVKSRRTECKILLEEISPAIASIYEYAIKNIDGLSRDIIKPEIALDQSTSNDLVIVLDNHRKNSTESPELIDKLDQVVLIDHHRRGPDYIENPILTYLEPYASSTAELVTELIQYSEDNIEINNFFADALLAGITVDTKKFTIQTGVRTFEAAALLKRFGADSIAVKKLFREDADTVRDRSDVVASAKIYKNNIAISRYDKNENNSVLVAAQSADSMLDIKGVKASFVLTRFEDKIHISGRSVGEISVQLILENLAEEGISHQLELK